MPRLWSWARIPSYLSSTQTSGPSRAMISAASSAGDASMNLSGWKSASEALARASSRARPASRPTSPTSIPAHLTSSSGRSKARAMAASTSPSRSPMRRSPPRTLTMYLAVSGSERSRSVRRIADLRAGPDASSISANAAATSGSVGLASGGGAWPAARSTSATAMPRSDERSYASPSADRGTSPISVTVVAIADQPRPAARWSASANGRPVRKTAATGSSSGVRVRR